MKKILLFQLIFGLVTINSNAHEGTSLLICFTPAMTTSYTPKLPLERMVDFTGKISLRGVEVDINHFIKNNLSLGLTIGMTIFKEKSTDKTLDNDDLFITGNQFRNARIVPLNVTLKKYFTSNSFSPYAGIGIGTNYAKLSDEIGIVSINNVKWQFNVAPEVGMYYNLNHKNMIVIKVKCNYSPKTGDFPTLSYMAFGFGLGF